MPTRPKSVVLPGVGHRLEVNGNAIDLANIPHWDGLFTQNSMTLSYCSGIMAELPDDQRGNSEVGYLPAGNGGYVPQDLSWVNSAGKNRGIFIISELCWAVDEAKSKDKVLRMLDLLTPSGAHRYEHRTLAKLELAANSNSQFEHFCCA